MLFGDDVDIGASSLKQAYMIVDLNREPSRGLVFDIRVISAVAAAPCVPVAQSLKYSISCDWRD